MQKTPATLARDEGQKYISHQQNTGARFERPYLEADRAAIRRLMHQIDEDPTYLDNIYNRMVADILQQQMASHWMERAAQYDAVGDRYTAARCRVHAHLLKDGNLLDPEIEDDMLIYRAAPKPMPQIAPLRDELLVMIEDEMRARNA